MTTRTIARSELFEEGGGVGAGERRWGVRAFEVLWRVFVNDAGDHGEFDVGAEEAEGVGDVVVGPGEMERGAAVLEGVEQAAEAVE